MLERNFIQTQGFRNVEGGFTLRLRSPYYRGFWGSLIDGVTVTVDGEVFGNDQVVGWQMGGKRYSFEEMVQSPTAHWAPDEPVDVLVSKPGGLARGIHEVHVELVMRNSYIPAKHQPNHLTQTRKVTIVK